MNLDQALYLIAIALGIGIIIRWTIKAEARIDGGSAERRFNEDDSPTPPIMVHPLRRWQRVLIYLGILAILAALMLLFDHRYHVGEDRAAAIVGGAFYLLAATGHPWWLYDTVRHVRWFDAISDDASMRVVLIFLGVLLLALGAASSAPST